MGGQSHLLQEWGQNLAHFPLMRSGANLFLHLSRTCRG